MMKNETALVLRAQQGRSDAFEQLVATYERSVLYFIGCQLGDIDRALDISQEVWITVWKSIGKLKDSHSFRGWLFQITRRRILQEYRRQRRPDWEHDKQYDDMEFAADDASVDMAILIDDLNDAIDKLAERLREVVILHYLSGLSVEDVSLAINCPIGTVKSRLYYARKELKRLLEGNRIHG